jgi:hypothetical protein
MGHPMDADVDRVIRAEQERSAKLRTLIAKAQAWVDERDVSDGEESKAALDELCSEARDIIASLLHEMGAWGAR